MRWSYQCCKIHHLLYNSVPNSKCLIWNCSYLVNLLSWLKSRITRVPSMLVGLEVKFGTNSPGEWSPLPITPYINSQLISAEIQTFETWDVQMSNPPWLVLVSGVWCTAVHFTDGLNFTHSLGNVSSKQQTFSRRSGAGQGFILLVEMAQNHFTV